MTPDEYDDIFDVKEFYATSSFQHQQGSFLGKENAAIELIQYGGYQCTHCVETLPVIRKLQHALGDNLRFIFRHFPLPNLHHLALEAALAAEAAGLQGKFWPMHFRILENQMYLNRASFDWLAEDIKLNMSLFELHRRNRHLIKKITSDFESGIHSGINGTPTFFINGRRYNGFDDFESLYKVCRFAAGFYKMMV